MSRSEYIEFVDSQLRVVNSDLFSLEDQARVCNGVGSRMILLRLFTVPDDIELLFSPAADWHDVAYCCGGGEQHRAYADTEFYIRVIDAAYDVKGFYPRLRARIWSLNCLLAVRIGGELSFEYRDEPIPITEYIASVKAAC